ncbi:MULTISPECIES: LysR family transcriptional regulator [unclassified Undibacterium]|jgi:DNA-binding transcriptional LysR family regulator|uniref:LysR family transcriptional regulator n=1 Tax=unclassified Undibacterium TaxID=2630295 RepID=UPI00164C6FE0|nr:MULTISPECIES: LysR family transcriptional regulator [unclassified Undibacterium]MBC3876468.1 LysR family transcriptional regulator [Undibacterium sp. FT79W]MBC3927850.1 LysR family transcriptional regulator [Undibacterium sp. CY21W]MBK1889652.1 LysR family transcriptional regulator [Undibacterium sp. 14-3-2]
MRLRHIEVFHAIMQAGTISGAAQLLSISQPAATKVLQHCELQLGLKLFERIKGKLHPTPEAHKLFSEVDKLNRDLQSVRRLANNLKNHPDEAVRLASTPTLSITVVPAALAAWRKKFPQVHCTLSTHHTSDMVNALLLGDVDFALSLYDPCHPNLASEPLVRGSMTAIAPIGSWTKKLDNTPLSVADLPKNLIALDLDDHLVSRVMDACEELGISFTSYTEVQTYVLARTLVEFGAGAAVIDPFTAATANHDKVQCRPLLPNVPVDLYLLTKKSTPLSRSARAFVECVQTAAAEFIARTSKE